MIKPSFNHIAEKIIFATRQQAADSTIEYGKAQQRRGGNKVFSL